MSWVTTVPGITGIFAAGIIVGGVGVLCLVAHWDTRNDAAQARVEEEIAERYPTLAQKAAG